MADPTTFPSIIDKPMDTSRDGNMSDGSVFSDEASMASYIKRIKTSKKIDDIELLSISV